MADLRLEVDRFEWAAEDRLEVAGRWHGIRGRVFLRPSLDVRSEDGPRRLLALLEHKPWSALEGEEWIVAFPWSGPQGLAGADLAAGSDVIVSLPAPGHTGTARPPVAPASPEPRSKPQPDPKPDQEPDPEEPVELPELTRARAERVSATGARDAALEQWRKAQEELEEAHTATAAADERRRATEQARDEAVAASDQVRSELRAAEADRDFAREQLAGAERKREEAVGGREEAARELHRASSSSSEVEAARDEAVDARRTAEAERDEAAAKLKEAEAALENLTGQRDAARSGPATLPAPARGAQRPRHQGLRVLVAGALVVMVLVLIVLVLLSL